MKRKTLDKLYKYDPPIITKTAGFICELCLQTFEEGNFPRQCQQYAGTSRDVQDEMTPHEHESDNSDVYHDDIIPSQAFLKTAFSDHLEEAIQSDIKSLYKVGT